MAGGIIPEEKMVLNVQRGTQGVGDSWHFALGSLRWWWEPGTEWDVWRGYRKLWLQQPDVGPSPW